MNPRKWILIAATILLAEIFVPVPQIAVADAFCGPFSTTTNGFHLLGCSPMGEDMTSALIHGSIRTAAVAVFARFSAVLLCIIFTIIAWLLPVIPRYIIERTAEAMMSIPSLLLALAAGFLFGHGFLSIISAIGLSEWSANQIWMLGRLDEHSRKGSVKYALQIKASRRHVFLWHLKLYLKTDIQFLFFINLPGSLLTVAALEFLGISDMSTSPGLGYMIAAWKEWVFQYPHTVITPVITVCLLVLWFSKLNKSSA